MYYYYVDLRTFFNEQLHKLSILKNNLSIINVWYKSAQLISKKCCGHLNIMSPEQYVIENESMALM